MSLHVFLAQLAAAGLYTPPNYAPRATNGHPVGPPADPGELQSQTMGRAALVSECAAFVRTKEGARNHELNRSSFRMGQLVGAGYLPRPDAEDALLDAAHATGLSPTEAQNTIASGLTAGISQPRVVSPRPGPPPTYTLPDLGGNRSGTGAPDGAADSPDDLSGTGAPDGAADSPDDLSGTGGDLPGTGADTPPGTGLPPILDWHAVWATGIDPDWLVPDILERGRSHALYAPHKDGKSLLTLTLCAQLAIQGVHVLYVDLENSVADIVERLQDMGHGPADLATLHYLSFPNMAALDTPGGGATLYALVQEYASELVILDTTSRIISGKENEADTFRALYRHALVPLKAAGVTLLRLDHAGKDLTAGQRGSSAKGDDVDTVWLLTKHDDTRHTLQCSVQRTGHHPQSIELAKKVGPLRFERVTDPFSRPEVTVVLDALERLRVPLDTGRIVASSVLIAAGIRVRTSVLAEAIKIRKSSIECSKNLYGTGQSEVDLALINNRCSQDQLSLEETPDQTCSGQPGTGGNRSSRASGAAPVPDPVRPEGGQVGGTAPADPVEPAGFSPPEDQLEKPLQDPLLCAQCQRPSERLIGPPSGRQLCPDCAYPIAGTRPGADHEREDDS